MRVDETFIEKLEETEKYIIDKIMVKCFSDDSEMFKLTLKVGDKRIFLKRYSNYEFYLKSIREKGSSLNPELGFFYDYGLGTPLQEFENDDLLDFTYLSCQGGIFTFCGNHMRTSGAFRYHIWDRKLAEEVDERLGKAIKLPMYTPIS